MNHAVRDPERTIREHAGRTVDLIIHRLVAHRAHLLDRAVERATTLGVKEYGEGAWSKTPEQLLEEFDDEICDAFFYGGARFDVLDELATRAAGPA